MSCVIRGSLRHVSEAQLLMDPGVSRRINESACGKCLPKNRLMVGADLRSPVPSLLGVQRGTVGDASSAHSRSQARHLLSSRLLTPAFHFPAFLWCPSYSSSLTV